MLVLSLRLPLVSEKVQTERTASIQALIQQELERLRAAAERRVAKLSAFLSEIDAARGLSGLEDCEKRAPHVLGALTGELDVVLDRFEHRLESEEERVLQRALDDRLAAVAETDASEMIEADEAPPSSDLVLKLREFIEEAEKSSVALEVANQKLILARTALQALRAGMAEESSGADLSIRQLDQKEAEELSPLVVELALLVSALKAPTAPDPVESADIGQPVLKEDISAGAPETEPAGTPTVFPLSTEMAARYQEDYYRHVGLYQSLLQTAVTDAHFKELIAFKELLDYRRNELGEWRSAGGYQGDLPLFFVDSYVGALPGESHVRGKPGKRKKKSAKKQGSRQKYSSAEVSQILRDFTHPYRPSRAVGRKSNFNGKIFITTGKVNPRANKRRGDW